ncbi:FlaD/FlaE family flagellar protein [Thermococcus barophilus]|uniref:Archaeal flagella protein D n=1 Tax=Thermococcus barophilus TaxID=55802 RepID=A0A0S1XC38_THEBA|nr:FlaD/FlaE family flagellar protein [Thermococcus barophilus]ALM75358.1 Archaeal flagella protein D [Thermococcus barophilus]
MEEVRLVTEADINAKLSELKGKVPTVVINDLREKLLAKKDTLTYEQLERIIQRVLDAYGSQATKYEQISKRVDELGQRLSELSAQLSRLIESLEEKKFEIHEKKAEKVEEKIEKVKEKLEKIEEKIEEGGEEVPSEIIEELPEKIEELHEKVEEIAEKIEEEKPEEAKVEAVEEVGVEEISKPEEIKPEEVTEEVKEEIPIIEEVPKEEVKPEEEFVEEKVEEEEKVEVVEAPEEIEKVEEAEEVKTEEKVEVPAHEEVKEEKMEGGVEMAEEKLSLPPDIANLLFAEEPKKARLEKIPEDIVSTMIALKWLGFLIDRVGIQNLERILEFYYEIGWISENVLNTLLRYAKGTRPHHRDPEWKPAEKLTVQDHLVSLLFIERLRGLRITRDVLDKLERELKMLEKTLDEFYGV